MPRQIAVPSSLCGSRKKLGPNWWRNAPPGMSPETANEFLARLKAGSTVRTLTLGLREAGSGYVTRKRFKEHCEIHPEWATEAWGISKANTKAGRSARFRALTHCKHGHPLSGDNLYTYVSQGRTERKCLTCNKRLAEAGRRVSEQQARQVVEALNDGMTISQITKTGPSYILNSTALLLFRKKHPRFGRLVMQRSRANAIIHHAEAHARRAQLLRSPSIAHHGGDIFSMIRSTVPATLPRQVRDDVIGAMALAIVEGKLRPTDIPRRLHEFVTAQFRLFSKFGPASLDAPLQPDSNATLLDRLSTEVGAGYWDANMMASSGRRI